MKNRIIKTVFAAMLKLASLLCAEAFAVIVPQFRCSADRFRCYRITAKTSCKTLIEQRNISNKTPQKAPEKISFAVLSLFRPDNSENGGIRSPAEMVDDIPSRRPSAGRVGSRKGAKARRTRAVVYPTKLAPPVRRQEKGKKGFPSPRN